jgi:hypothetical protein
MDDIMKSLGPIKVLGALVSGLLVATAAGAQSGQSSEIATLKGVTGNVLVSQQSGLATGSEAQRIVKGTRIITTANSEVVVVFDKGCEVKLRENERLDVDSDRACAALVPFPLGGGTLVAAGSGFPGFLAPIAVIPFVARGGGSGQSTPVSPN